MLRPILRLGDSILSEPARTALQHAVVKDKVEAVRVLLECGADPDAQQSGATHARVRTWVTQYARVFVEQPQIAWGFYLAQVLVTMLLVVIGTNVAVLVYARTATRMGEIAVRSALGASRARIVGPGTCSL